MDKPLSSPDTVEDVFRRLDGNSESLSKGARQIAQFMRDRPADMAALNAGEIADSCGVHASSVVRLAQAIGFSGYRELQAVFKQHFMSGAAPMPKRVSAEPNEPLSLRIIAESGPSFNKALAAAAEKYCEGQSSVRVRGTYHLPHEIDAEKYAAELLSVAEDCDGLILVARDERPVSRAVRDLVDKGLPVVCLTSDLPSSGRTAYVGSDQYAAGTTAAWLCGRMAQQSGNRVLLVYSVPFRCQLDRESGFRQCLRSTFPNLTIDERVSSNENVDVTYEAVRRYIRASGPPVAIYNVSGGNLGVGRALDEEGLAGNTVFIGHELNENSRKLLESGAMDFAIGHPFDREIELAVNCIRAARAGMVANSYLTEIQLYTRFNCAP
jgi:LacI family transcriptional regulator